MSRSKTCRCHADASAAGGMLWLMGWLFTLGYLHLPFFWKGVLALIVWPYYLGVAVGEVSSRARRTRGRA